MSSIQSKLSKDPKNLFLIDGIGALVSAFFLGIILVRFEAFFGIPKSVLYFLAAIPCFFFFYDLCCYFFGGTMTGILLKGIAIMNITYVILSLGLAFRHVDSLSIFGWLYVIGEILIIVVLAKIEYNTGEKWNRSQSKLSW